MRRVVPHARADRRRPVVDDPAADEHDPVDDVLDGAELVRDVEDRDAELARAAPRAGGRATPATRRRHPSSARRARAASARTRAPSRSAHAAACRPRASAAARRPGRRARRVSIARVDGLAVGATQRAPDARRCEPAGRDDLADGHRRLADEPCSAAADSRCACSAAPSAGRSPKTRDSARPRPLEPEHEPQQRRLAAPVRPGDRDELARRTASDTASSTGIPGPVAERDAGRARRPGSRRASERLPERRQVRPHDREVVGAGLRSARRSAPRAGRARRSRRRPRARPSARASAR